MREALTIARQFNPQKTMKLLIKIYTLSFISESALANSDLTFLI